MALIKCKECGAQVSTKANACPACGAVRPKQTRAATWFIGAVAVFAIGGTILEANKSKVNYQTTATQAIAPQRPPPPERTPAQLKADREINTVLAGARALKSAMKKPETFEIISASMIDGKVICYEYRARNSFNDRRTEYYVVTDTVSNGKPETWNKYCAGKSGTDYSSVRAVL